MCYHSGTMVEREEFHIPYDSEDLREEIARVDSLGKFRYVLHDILPGVPVDAFTYDFAAQIDLRAKFEQYGHKTKTDKETPVIILKEPGSTNAGTETIGGTTAIEPYRFRLDDADHIYYFNRFPKQEPLHVRFMDTETQIFPPSVHSIHPLQRVPVSGGMSQSYSYEKQLWLPSNQGIFRGVGIHSRMRWNPATPR